jgi:UDP-N-acetylmuramate dehydrogenase
MPHINIYSSFSLQSYNTFGLPAFAENYISIGKESDITDIIRQGIIPKEAPIHVLGGGSNILLTQDVKGYVLHNQIKGIVVEQENDTDVWVRVGGGEVWHEWVLYCVEKGWGGVENLSLIPGSVGAAPMQNIGAYGAEIKDTFVYVEGIFLRTGERRKFSHAECEFGYRESVFKRKIKEFFITQVCFRLSKFPKLNTAYGDIQQQLATLPYSTYTLRDVSNAVIHIRQSKLPNPQIIGNAGSFFKNPTVPLSSFIPLQQNYPDMPFYMVGEAFVKIPAAWLIQQCGWKGKRFGNYGVHEKQALVLVNYGGAKGNDIYDLSEKILVSVENTFGIRLEREVNIL